MFFSQKSDLIVICFFSIREMVGEKLVETRFVATEQQLVGIEVEHLGKKRP